MSKSIIDINHLEGRELQEETSAKKDGKSTSFAANALKMEHNVKENIGSIEKVKLNLFVDEED